MPFLCQLEPGIGKAATSVGGNFTCAVHSAAIEEMSGKRGMQWSTVGKRLEEPEARHEASGY